MNIAMSLLSGPTTYPQSLTGIRFLANPVPFDPTLPTYIESEFKLLRHHARAILSVLERQDLENVDSELAEYRQAVKSYLKVVSMELYVHLRHGLAHEDPRRAEFLRFEKHTFALVKLIAGFLKQCDLIPRQDVDRLKSVIYKVDQLLVSKYREEKKVLWPMYEL